jgi:CRP/FNR family transcriptional regulator, dissimilatory nitrate respiration regulator
VLQNVIFEIKMDFGQLIKSPLFSGLNQAEIEKLITSVPYRIRKFNTGSLIAQSGEPVSSLLIVLTGTVKGEMEDEAGRVIKIEDVPAPGALAAAFIFGNKNRFPVNVIAMFECEILFIAKSDFLSLLMRESMLLVNFLNIISSRSQFLSEKIKFLNFRTIREKLAHFILQAANRDNSEIILEKSQNELADFFGVARPSVSRALGELNDLGVIKASGKRIRIIDRKGLIDLTRD